MVILAPSWYAMQLQDMWCTELDIVPKILDQTDRVGAKSPIFDLFSLVATQP